MYLFLMEVNVAQTDTFLENVFQYFLFINFFVESSGLAWPGYMTY